MSKFIKQEVRNIEISGIRKFNALANEVEGVIKLTIGELDMPTPEATKIAAIKAISNNKTKYTQNKGIVELREKIVKKYNNYNPEEVILTVGTTEGLGIVLKSIIEENDEVIIPTPGYVGYKPLITLEKGKVVELDTTISEFKITKLALESCYSTKTKCIIITSPNNPTGSVLDENEIKIIREFVLEKDILLISDEIYSDIIFIQEIDSFNTYSDLKNNLVILNGFSKSHAMTGFRIGYVISSLQLINQFVKVHQYNVTSTSTISQYAALEAIDNQYVTMLEDLASKRQLVLDTFRENQIKYIPSNGAFYIFYDISDLGYTSLEYCKELLYKHKIALIPGEFFLGNNKNYVRLSYAVHIEKLEKALKEIIAFKKAND